MTYKESSYNDSVSPMNTSNSLAISKYYALQVLQMLHHLKFWSFGDKRLFMSYILMKVFSMGSFLLENKATRLPYFEWPVILYLQIMVLKICEFSEPQALARWKSHLDIIYICRRLYLVQYFKPCLSHLAM